ncbi:hypothetical protein ACH40F_08100 [Streptomyces sp. NPDC020794]|uniref:hypothetical protein n=1 Tax=unclassified Streptomyces TaxID=2593676 RepID=UPI0036E00005
MTDRSVGPRCGNNPNVQLTDRDRKAIDDFKARLTLKEAAKPYIERAVWVDGDPLMEVIAVTVWERCARDDENTPQLVCDDPRTIAAFAAAVARAHAAVPSAPADRATCPDPIECGHEAALGQARETNRRLNYRAQQLESELAAYRRAVSQWEINEHRTYVPLRTLAVIAKAAGRDIETPQWLLHYQRVEQAEAAVERVRSVLESEAVVGRSALDYRGLITTALMADDAPDPSRVAGEAPGPWLVHKICCGRDDGKVELATWEEADRFREEYIDSARIASHERSAIVRAARADWAAIYREVADRLAADAEQGEKEGFTRIYRRSAAMQVREWANEAQQPTPCSQPNPCEDGELCATHEEEQAHAEGEHAFCGVRCEVAMPAEPMRNTILCRAVPGASGMLDELLRRAATGQLPAVDASSSADEATAEHHTVDGALYLCHTGDHYCPDGQAQQPETQADGDPSWPRRAWDLGLLHKGGDPHHCPACLKQPEPPPNFVCPGDNTEVLANPQPSKEA